MSLSRKELIVLIKDLDRSVSKDDGGHKCMIMIDGEID
jgi:hypothetical protein